MKIVALMFIDEGSFFLIYQDTFTIYFFLAVVSLSHIPVFAASSYVPSP